MTPRLEGLPAPPTPPGPPGGSWSLSVRALRCWLTVYRRIWRSSVWSSVLAPLCYLGALGYGLGSLVDKHAHLDGVPYPVFVAPAILAVQAMTSGLSESSYRVFGAVKWNKIYVAAQATPLRPSDICRGHLLFMTARITMNSAIFVLVMAAFGVIRSPWGVFLLPSAVLTGAAFAAPVAAWSVTLRNETPFTYIFRFGAVPMMLFSGTFFQVTQLPGWLRPVAYATPLWHGVALCRAFSLGAVDAASTAAHVGYLAAITAAGLWAGAATYRRRLYV